MTRDELDKWINSQSWAKRNADSKKTYEITEEGKAEYKRLTGKEYKKDA